jgi:hypothetical protein
MFRSARLAICLVALAAAGCGGPSDDDLRDSFAAQLAANRFLKDVQRAGDDITFSGAGAEGGTARWRVHVDSAVIEETGDAAMPYKGTVSSSWYSDGQIVLPVGKDSNLPIELTSNGLAQVCFALWDPGARRWSWE